MSLLSTRTPLGPATLESILCYTLGAEAILQSEEGHNIYMKLNIPGSPEPIFGYSGICLGPVHAHLPNPFHCYGSRTSIHRVAYNCESYHEIEPRKT